MNHRISDFCPFAGVKECPGTCRGICPDGTTVRCYHLVEAEMNRKAYLNKEEMPMWKHLTRVVRETL